MKRSIHISIILFLGLLLSIITSCTSVYDDSVCVHAESVEGNNTEYFDVRKYLLSNNNDNRTEMLAADVSQLGSLAVNLRVMVKLTARQIYKTSVLWAKYAVRMIAEYMQHQSFISECLNSSKFRVGMTGNHVRYLYQLCRVVI
ncbi:hypothetical protein I6E11_04110 [Bacteroides caecigallinarum]|uniref:hypothetical protein n=1 Tax=Bacteroides caecigallinarum TaxID=1411144 RepID=UPI001F1A7014|nr:hypothetical protein [Bacteroides caecigallinarum]MCF2592995.1 hypothetical protein [Bacteroides caecigallinarum]